MTVAARVDLRAGGEYRWTVTPGHIAAGTIVENNRIASIRSAGTPGLPQRTSRPPDRPDFEIDATGMYVLPGFVDLHVHAGGPPKNAEAEYAYKLWLAHGVTTVRGVSLEHTTLDLTGVDAAVGDEGVVLGT